GADTSGRPVLIADVAGLLEAVPDLLIITARDGSLLFASPDARALTFQQVEQLGRLARAPVSGRASGTVRLEPDGPRIHYVVHYLVEAGPQFGAILAGANVRSAELGPEQRLAPLTVLRAGVERAITTPNMPQDTLAALDETLQEIKRMTELVDALLTLARADEGTAPLHRASVDLRTIVEEARETGELLAEQAGVKMDVTTPPDPVIVPVDASRIRQLILNLLTNAVKYTPAGGRVRMQLVHADGRVTLTVADTGIGIAPGDLPHIFDRFWRADSARTRTGERSGAGLGLAICKWIAEAHGGRIDVVSRPGRGTTFTVTLPREPPATET